MASSGTQSGWQRLVSALAEGILVVDEHGEVVFANPRAGELFGRAPRDLAGEHFAHPLSVAGHREIEILRPGGDVINAEMAVAAGAWEDRDAWVVTLHDVTARKRAQERLRLAASVFSHAREGIIITDPEGTIVDVNDAFTEVTAFPRAEAVGQSPRILKSDRHGTAFYEGMWGQLLERGFWRGEIWNRRKGGELYPELLNISAIHDDQGQVTHYIGVFFDISEQKEQERRLEEIAHYDVLTGLPNRALLADRLYVAMVQARRSQRPLAVVYVDLDDFKAVNDRHGHDAGDRLLVAVAGRLRASLRAGDTVARLGGDEFVVVVTECSEPGDSEALVERLLAAVREPLPVAGHSLRVTASLGVTFFPQGEEVDADQLLRQADQAMYQAKLTGKGHGHLFDSRMDQQIKDQHERLERIRRALEAGEFVLHYQPKVNLRSGEVIGMEALIRWQHPEQGLLSPGSFLPAIEKHPLAVALGEWVIDQALAQMEAWAAAGLEMPVSVNIGALHLQRDDFVARLQGLLAAHPGIRPELLGMEVLETSALEDMDRASAVMGECARLGLTFALDDFGIGYSSLTYLKQLPAGQLKIDRSFVMDMLDDPEDLAILEGVIGLATAFQRQVVAEGVETEGQGELLLHLGCDLAQGYAIARPMPAARVADWVGGWAPPQCWRHAAPVAREDLPALFAGVEHRAWVRALNEYFQGVRDEPPPLDTQQCRFGRWLHGPGRERHGASPAFARIAAAHQRVHDLARQWLQEAEGLSPLAAPELARRLEEQGEALQAGLRALVQDLHEPSPGGRPDP